MVDKSPSPSRYIEDLLAGQMRARSLAIAHRLGLFAALADRTCEVTELSNTLGVHVTGLRKLLATLETMELVGRSGDGYELTEIARHSLIGRNAQSFGEFVDFFTDQFESKPISLLLNHLRIGGPVRPATTPDQWRHYMAAMDRMAHLSADRIAQAMQLDRDQTLLDLGGGPGLYAIAACNRYPHVNATILDLDDALHFAHQNISDARLADRIRLRPGSVTDGSYGGPYDVILLSHTIHLFDERTVQRIFSACHTALGVDGRLVVRDLFTDGGRTQPALGSLVAFHMWNEGDAYSVPQTTGLLVNAGFQPPRHVQFRDEQDPEILGSLLISRKTDSTST
ncbi:Demethylspheroidene O-methyltransferase [Stieleria neptunia]|uniref:Demethylspheroidene O-methyltransferase n=2 Tax=Stieleria neptunia TaxID=2527979 RepID=A0A518HKL5_9BACT|nr:Demethylspheroidene O-methyltransferase [Stieleria neptunia]